MRRIVLALLIAVYAILPQMAEASMQQSQQRQQQLRQQQQMRQQMQLRRYQQTQKTLQKERSEEQKNLRRSNDATSQRMQMEVLKKQNEQQQEDVLDYEDRPAFNYWY